MILVYVSYDNVFVFVVIITNFAGISNSVKELDGVDSLDKVVQRQRLVAVILGLYWFSYWFEEDSILSGC